MRRIAITGISGYIGSRLLSRLSETEGVERIVGIDVKPPRYSSPKLKFYCQDISHPLGDVFAGNEVDTAVHLAFVLKPTHNRKNTRQVDVGGTLNFIEACRQAQVNHVLYLSSHTVYGAHPDNTQPLDEDSVLRPLSNFQYSRDKAEAERMLRDFTASQGSVCLTILRSCPVLGPNADNSIVTSMFKPVMIRIAGYDPPMQFVHEADLVEFIITLLRQKKAGIFNIAGDGELRYSQVARLSRRRTVVLPERFLRFIIGFSWTLRFQSESPTSGLEFIKYPPIVSTEKIKRETGFQFSYSSRDAVVSFLSVRQ